MGDIIGETSLPSTWALLRVPVLNADVTGGTTIYGSHNVEYPAGAYYVKTIEGNGLIRTATGVSGPSFDFTENTPPTDDYFIFLEMHDPYPEQLTGRTVTTSSSSFTLIVDAFSTGQSAGSGGTTPVTSVEWFEDIP